eukprot:8017377-Ditylum_brightwellii.AAC.1
MRVYTNLTNRGFKPALSILDNEASSTVKRCIKATGAAMQLVEPHNHHVNAAERAVRTFKEHFIAGLCTTDKDFPIRQWDELIEQTFITLNLLRTSRANPRLSPYAHLEGMFDYNKTPLALPGTRALIYDDPNKRLSWAPHCVEGWYVGPAMEHYWCYQFHIPSTGDQRIAATADFFPQHC